MRSLLEPPSSKTRATKGMTPLFQTGAQAGDKLALHYAGVHRREDRDSRAATNTLRAPKRYWNMIRVRVPAGVLSSEQYLALDDLATRFTSNRSLRLTVGQSVQLHGVASDHLQEVVERLAEAGLAAGCDPSGLEFAISVSPLPIETDSYIRLRALASELCDHLYPVPGESAICFPQHPPRKLAIALSIPNDNAGNIFACDAGILLVNDAGGKPRINVYAGGSASMPSRRPDTYARLSSPLGSLDPEDALPFVRGLASVFRKHGRLGARKHPRLKYVLDDLGLDEFRREVQKESGLTFFDLVPLAGLSIPAWSGVRDQLNGDFSYGLHVPFGRIQDRGTDRLQSALRLIVETFRTRVILTPDQNLLLADLRLNQVDQVEKVLAAYHVPYGAKVSKVRAGALACAGLPTCPVAVAESERAAPAIVDGLESELARIGRDDSDFSFRMSGCAIGCIRSNMVDLGVIGRAPGRYDLYLGGNEAKGWFSELYAEGIAIDEIIPAIRPVLEYWAAHSFRGEPFSEFYHRAFARNQGAMRLVSCTEVPARERIESRIAA